MQTIWILLPVIFVVALALGFLAHKWIGDKKLGEARARAERIVGDAQRDADACHRSAELEAKEIVLKARTEFEAEVRKRQREIEGIEQRILNKEEQLARKLDELERKLADYTAKDRSLVDRDRALGEKEARLAQALDEQKRKLETIAGLTAEEAKRQLLGQMEQEARREAQIMAMRLEEEAKETAHVKAKEVLATTIQRLAPDYTVETAVSVVDLPSDDMKGRIIGREGRNIRALELHTGVDLIVDDTPEAVLISAYDPYRREIARRALGILIADGRIHPARIEEVVEKVKKEMEQHLKEEGEKACFEVGVHGLHPELVKLVGRMKYRTSYGQNCLQHSKEVAWLAGMMAAEIKGDVKLAKRMGLLHDIGKALTHEQEGSHPELSLQ
ncbi:MAG: ribonuclease Y, partial [Candidatus Rokubacteria bacterium]|nr:ribonuclease Y [Candidatus Rokubacteria bacterium]